MSNIINYDMVITTSTPMLGSQPGRDDPASKFIRDKTREKYPAMVIPEDEIESLPEEISKGTTAFYRDENDRPILKSYQIKGCLKEAASVMNGTDGMKNLRSKIENAVFFKPINLAIEYDGVIGIEERPLRAMTMQGPRVSLARSEKINEGAIIKCRIEVWKFPKCEITEDLLRELLDYAQVKGLGQWRNSGIFGQFSYKLEKMEA